MPEVGPEKDDTKRWTLFTGGESSLKGSGAGLVLIGPSGVEYTYALRLTFTSTNNEAEYEALLAGLRIARKMKIQNLEAKVDSKLVTSEINGSYVASSDSMIKYLAKENEYIACFKSFSIKNIPRNLNQKADVFNKLASVAFNHLTKEIRVEVLNERSTDTKEINTVVEQEENNWVTPIIQCLEKGKLCHLRDIYRGLRNAFRATIGGSKGDEAELEISSSSSGKQSPLSCLTLKIFDDIEEIRDYQSCGRDF
ncbi:reverse transcriptase domain-containing protein [Tanacetum coccineum]